MRREGTPSTGWTPKRPAHPAPRSGGSLLAASSRQRDSLESMRALAEPKVLRSALIAALLSALVCFPRLSLWSTRVYPLWYLEALLFLGGTVLWAFVFAWHTNYTGLPVFTSDVRRGAFLAASCAGLGA